MEQGRLDKEMRKDQIQEMNVSYERRYRANFFSISNFVIDFCLFLFNGGWVHKMYLILKG